MSNMSVTNTNYMLTLIGNQVINTTVNGSSATSSQQTQGQSMRITGMVSGLDVDGTVKKLMTPDQMKIDAVNQKMQKASWGQQMYSNIITDLKNFQNTYFNVASPSMNIASPTFFNSATTTSSNSSILTATADTTAQQGTYSVTVNNVATGASISGSNFSSIQCTDASGKPNATTWKGVIDFNIGGTRVSIDTSSASINGDTDYAGVVAAINNQLITSPNSDLHNIVASYGTDSSGKAFIKFSNSTGKTVQITGQGDNSNPPSATTIADINTATTNSTNPINLNTISSTTKLSDLGYTQNPPGKLVLNYNGTPKTIDLNSASVSTVGDLINAINTTTSGAVTAKLDSATGAFTLQTTGTGSQTSLSIDATNSDANLVAILGLTTTSGGKVVGKTSQGKDANVTIVQPDGTSESMSSSTNSLNFNGVALNITGTTISGNPATNTPVSITVTNDTDSLFNKFKGFIDNYNNLVTEISTKINETPNNSYQPLTSAQASQMSATDIQNWNAKAQQGLLYKDDNLSNMLSALKDTFYTAVNKATTTFGSKALGVDFSTDYTKDGTLVFSDGTGDAFKQALKSHASDVINLFTQTAPSTDTGSGPGSARFNDEGIFQRINDTLIQYVDITGLDKSTHSILGKKAYKQDDYSLYGGGGSNTFLDQIYQYQIQINKMQDDFNTKQQSYYTQFSNLETAMAQLNAQQSQLQGMLGGSSGA